MTSSTEKTVESDSRSTTEEQNKQVIIDGIIYPSMSIAGRAHGLDYSSVGIRINSDEFPTWMPYTPPNQTKKGTKEVIPEHIPTQGMVVYCDGGCKPNPGFGGWGMHGYIYSDEIPKKGSGNSSQYLTKYGYVEKSSVKNKSDVQEIKPVSYIDGYGSFDKHVTNNIGELAGATNGLQYAIDRDVKNVTIITDSEQVVKGSTDWLTTWKRNNWIKSDGNQVSNKEYWQALDNNLLQLKEKGVNVEFKWVKGHSTFLGNQLADKMASIGVLQSKDGKCLTEIDLKKADGYWSSIVDKHPLITQKRMYFSTRVEAAVPGEYFLGDHGKDDELLGKRTADGCFSYIRLKTPEPIMELMRKKQCDLASGLDVIIMAKLDKLFEADTYKDLMSYGQVCLYSPNLNKLDMHFVDSEPVTKELRPPRLAMRAVESVNTLKGILNAWLEKTDPNIVQTDITSIFYDIDAKKDYKLKPEFVVGFSAIQVEVKYGKKEETSKVDLCLGVDVPERNYLKRLEKHKPSIYAITWMESDKMFRYATIVKTEDDIGIFAGMYSNLRVIT